MFGLRKKNTPSVPVEVPIITLTYMQLNHIPRGSKRIKLSVYGHKPAEIGVAYFNGTDPSRFTLSAKVYEGEHPRVVIELDGTEIGTIWERAHPEAYEWFRSGTIQEVFTKIEGVESYIYVLPKNREV